MENLEFIENYFKGINDDAQRNLFEKKIIEDPSFAEEVAFYISANSVIQQQVQEEKKQRFREIYNKQKVISIKQPVRNAWRYLAAASVLIAVLVVAWLFTANKNLPQQLADNYIQQNFKNLSVTMGNSDSVQTGLRFLNSGKLTEALGIFETLVKNNSKNSEVKKYAGIVSLRLSNYDKALEYFTMLESNTGLYSNPGKFYKAITLLKRNKDGDKDAAMLLLEQVRDKNLEGKNEAEEWLKELN